MDHVREALDKANASLEKVAHSASAVKPAGPKPITPTHPAAAFAPQSWQPPEVSLDQKHLERHRVVAASMSDPAHVPFNLLRTRVRAAMDSNKWKSIGVTSPSPACGKTMVSINLALSFARATDQKVVLLDLDLKRPSIAETLGIKPNATLGAYLRGHAELSECFVRVGHGLIIGLGGGHMRDSSELLQGPTAAELLDFVQRTFAPDVLLFDLPPMGASDDALAFLPRTDAIVLVAAAGQTTSGEIDNCEQQIAEHGQFLGVVLNKAEIETKDYYY